MNETFRKPLLLAILSATAFGAASFVGAQEQTPAPATDEPTSRAAEATEANAADRAAPQAMMQTPIDDQKIDKFAEAYVAVQTIQTKAAQELDSASKDPAKQQQTQAAVENEMIAAVERTGLKLEEFNGIVQTMTADADLRAKVVAKIKERTGG
jgi:Domain of unknown function (DUF4168)